jgi:hypothetical protein
MIDHKNKIIFIHIPKTGGESITKMFWNEKLNLKKGKHKTIFDYEKEVDIRNYFCFCFVRHPYERIQSYYRYLTKQFPKRIKNIKFKDWVFDMIGEPKELFNTQISFINDKVKIFKFEKFNESLEIISTKTNMKIDCKIHMNKSDTRVPAELDEEIKEKIYLVYKEDFCKFRYEK